MKTNNFIQKASQQALSEILGFDEGQAYYLLLNNSSLEEEFSYSKKYRLLKSLFNLGAVAKIKPENQEFFNYIPLPPSFLHSTKTDTEIIIFLENIYLRNIYSQLTSNFSQIILKEEKGLLTFLLKYLMKTNAKFLTDDFNLKFLGINSEKVTIIKRAETKRKIGIIDNNFSFEFNSLINQNSQDYIGYISNRQLSSISKDYYTSVKDELQRSKI